MKTLCWVAKCDNKKCLGVVIDKPTLSVQRCDDCGRFKSDDEAANWVLEALAAGSEVAGNSYCLMTNFPDLFNQDRSSFDKDPWDIVDWFADQGWYWVEAMKGAGMWRAGRKTPREVW
jgi:hypothetical protein